MKSHQQYFNMIEIEYRNYISRKDLQNSRNTIFIFGDNDQRSGFGGQAKEMRGEPNAIGIRVKKSPSMSESAFYTDNEYHENVRKILEDLTELQTKSINKKIIFPTNGIGTGLAKLNIRAPKTFEFLTSALKLSFNIINKKY